MPLVDLSLVTKALVILLREGIAESDGWNGTTPNVTPYPPDKVDDDALGFYLYHVGEDTHYKNLPAPGGGNRVPVRQTPMALQLYYQLTAHNKTQNEDAVYTAQQLMGCAIKVFHDFPVVTDDTLIVGPQPILAAVGLDGAGNTLRITLQPMPQNEAVSYWTAGTGPTRLAAYYQVGAVLLDPEPPEARSGRVLSYGVHLFTAGAPHLDGSRCTLAFVMPNGQNATVDLRPAQVPFGGAFTLTGVSLGGDVVALSLRSAAWDRAQTVDGVAWGVAATAEQLTARVGATAGTETMLPGTYDAAVEVTRTRAMPGGGTRSFISKSNVVPIVVTPAISGVAVAGDAVTIAGQVFRHAALLPGAVEVYVGETRLAESAAAVPAPGEFVAASTQIDLRVGAEVPRGIAQPLRVLVNGAESAPRWVTVA